MRISINKESGYNKNINIRIYENYIMYFFSKVLSLAKFADKYLKIKSLVEVKVWYRAHLKYFNVDIARPLWSNNGTSHEAMWFNKVPKTVTDGTNVPKESNFNLGVDLL